MFGRFLPQEGNFFDLFDKHAAITLKSAYALKELFASNSSLSKNAPHIKQLEHEADRVVHQCVEELHKIFITPIERDDIYKLISQMDDVLDSIEEAADNVSLYKITEIKSEAKDLTALLVEAVVELEFAINGLRSLKNVEEIKAHCTKIYLLENQADAITRNAIGILFDEEQEIRNIIKWKEIYTNLEEAFDRCQDVANIIDGIILEMV
jgi:uncharacterized protein